MSRTPGSSALRPVAVPPAAWALPGARLAWLLIGVGVVLRLAQYLSNRSLWLDEAVLASTVVNRSFMELLDPLRYSQVAPLGFILIEKLAVAALGSAEYALRLFPLLCGVLALFLFYAVAKRCLKPEAVPIALALFAVSDPLIYFSSEVRQYSSDVAVALVLLWAGLGLLARPAALGLLAGLGLLGTAAIWLSHPSVFVLAGIALTSLVLLSRPDPLRRREGMPRRIFLAYAFWAVSFAACYLILLREASSNEQLVRYWEENRRAFMPLPTSPSEAVWLPKALLEFFSPQPTSYRLRDPVGLYLPGALFFALGCISMFRRNRKELLLLVSPLLVTLAASALRKYPFEGRLLLFLVPSVMLVVAEGVELVRSRVSHKSRVAGATLIMTLFAYPLLTAAHDLVHPRELEEMRPVLSYLREHRRPGDIVYLYYGAHPAFEYYAGPYRLGAEEIVVGAEARNAWGRYIDDLNRLRGRDRVWVLFSHVHARDGSDERRLFLRYLDAVGSRLDAFTRRGASVYLYDLESGEVGNAPAPARGSADAVPAPEEAGS